MNALSSDMGNTMLSPQLEAVPRWGLLPLAIAFGVALGARLGALALPRSWPREHALFGAVAALAVLDTIVRVLGALGALSRWTILAGLFVAMASTFLVHRDWRVGVRWRGLITKETTAIAVVAAVALFIVSMAAYFLPIWQWDALGYHLPYVNFALQSRSLSGVPADLPYVGTYPHVVENFFLAWRAMLPDDRLVDAAQIPFGLIGALAIAVLARQAGARRDYAVAAGLLWLTLPALFLQLPTNYVDVGAAALLLAAAALSLAEPTAAHVAAAGVALGLFLGSKPNAPVGTTLLFAVLAVRGWKAGRRGSLALAAATTALIGAESYVLNIVRHGNPIWPVRLALGPIVLPGELPMDALLASGCAAPRVAGNMLLRVLRSWTALDAPPVFDMRYGGLGVPFLLALPFAIALVVRRRSLALAVVMVVALASPDPAVPRYILAFPGVVFALAASHLAVRAPWKRHVTLGFAALAAAVGLYRAYPGLQGEGPPISAYLRLTESERLVAVGPDGSPERFHAAFERVPPGSTVAFDSSLELPYQAWPADLSRQAVHIRDLATDADAARIIADPNVSLLIVGDGSPVANAARAAEPPFTELFRCKARVPPACLAAAASAASATDGGRMLDILNQRWPSCVMLVRK